MSELRTVRDLRRAQIVAAARRLVAEGGLESLTIGALEQQLDFTRGVITYHFRDKHEIVVAVLESAVHELDRATFESASSTSSFADAVRTVLRSKVRGLLGCREARLILVSFWAKIPSEPRATRINSALFTGWRTQAKNLFSAAKAAGRIDASVPEDTLAALMVGLVLGIVTQASFEADALDVEAAVEIAAQMVLGVCNQPQGPSSTSSAGS